MINIGFWSNQLGERGTEIAMYNFAYYNQTILKNKSYIFYDKNGVFNNQHVIDKFKKEFEVVVGLTNFSDIDEYLLEHNVQILYNIKSGEHDGKISKVAKNVIHCVFNCIDPHGEVYCSLAKTVSNYNDSIPVLPIIVQLPYNEENMRKELNIPDDAFIFGRHGGKGQFDIPFVQDTVYNIAKANPDIYFIFVNTNKFCEELSNLIHLDTIIDLNLKRKFINTCDAMIWGRSDGETFGLAIAEFSICNKPVIVTNRCYYQEHVSILKDKGLWYSNTEDLINVIRIIVSADKNELKQKDWNAFYEYTPENVMKIFHKIAIEPFNL